MCILRGPRHVFDFVNEPYLELIGNRDLLGKTVAEALPEVVSQGFINVLDEVFRTGTPYIGKETEVFLQQAEDGPLSKVYINFVYQPIQEPDGSISGIFVHGIDITDEKEGEREREQLLVSERAARAEAERSSRMKDEFLATLSHELRTPLNAILGWSNVLRSGKVGEKEMRSGLETIERNARSQTQIIDDLLDMSRIISGKVRLDVQRIDLQEILREAIQTVQAAADAKGIRIHHVLDPLAGPVSGDPNRLQQVFWNLLNNSIKFTERGGRVQVLLERVNSHIEISVVDTGQGIKPEFLPHVFDRFQQADSSITRKYGGLGLGLAIVKQLVELHGGSVKAKSRGENQGATFVVLLPLTVLHEGESEDSRRHPRSGRPLTELPPIALDGINVLAVDDEPDARALVKTLLETSGANVTTAANAKEAFLLSMANTFDVLICDIGMPEEDGYTLMEKIRDSAGPNASTPAVALTAYARSQDRTKALRAGFQLHLSKPVEPVELVTVTASLAGKPRKLTPSA
jgi:signal transduction histidine kinase/ActR/RegA family two-component response regulator